jgi:hypothetical protein
LPDGSIGNINNCSLANIHTKLQVEKLPTTNIFYFIKEETLCYFTLSNARQQYKKISALIHINQSNSAFNGKFRFDLKKSRESLCKKCLNISKPCSAPVNVLQ